MSFRNLTWQQVALLIACIAGTFAAYKFLGPGGAGVATVVGSILTFMTGRDTPPPPPALAGAPSQLASTLIMAISVVMVWAGMALALSGCGSWFQDIDDAELQGVAVKLSKCRAEGLEAGTYEAYEGCKKREHIDATGYHPFDAGRE